MKKLLVFVMLMISICGLSGCKDNVSDEAPQIEAVSSDYGNSPKRGLMRFLMNLRI